MTSREKKRLIKATLSQFGIKVKQSEITFEFQDYTEGQIVVFLKKEAKCYYKIPNVDFMDLKANYKDVEEIRVFKNLLYEETEEK